VSAQPVESPDRPLFPMPPVTEAALRAAVKRINLAEAVRFDQEFRDAWQEAVQTDSTIPMRTFLRKWAEFVALHRYPARSARLHQLERAFQMADTDAGILKIGEEVAQLLAVAGAEVDE
jgi:hypothetical protein